ncbi:MAG: hypothetical protein CMF62_03495 [Magnetococcales bacterium]|nr:hypothetical protein [Magnetococcales bacterium]|tara:strand:+ start:53600 stop:54214 length:615 start_codon:yes stop_codon:yes gene_type:complete
MSYDFSFKISFIGDSQVGKSSLTHRLRYDRCPAQLQSTIGVEYESCFINNINNKKTRLEIWDTAGQEVYRSITKHYYRSSSAIILVYDICSKKSFLNLESWMDEIKENCCPDILIYLIGNKLDKEINREVKKEDVELFANKYSIPYYETSIIFKKNEVVGIESIFERLTEDLHNIISDNKPLPGIKLSEIFKDNKDEKSCCIIQ